MTSVPLRTISGLHESVIDYANRVHDLRSPSDVFNQLHDITKKVSLPVLGAARIPPKAADWDSVLLGKSFFVHKGAPKGWWEEYQKSQLPDLSTIIRVRSSLTDDSRLRGALPLTEVIDGTDG